MGLWSGLSLLNASSEQEWGFLHKCAINEYDDRWVDAEAIQTLKLIAWPRGRETLDQALRVNQEFVGASRGVCRIKTRAAGFIRPGNACYQRGGGNQDWDLGRASKITFLNKTRDWAFVDFDFIGGRTA
jgi:hypothetical protein